MLRYSTGLRATVVEYDRTHEPTTAWSACGLSPSSGRSGSAPLCDCYRRAASSGDSFIACSSRNLVGVPTMPASLQDDNSYTRLIILLNSNNLTTVEPGAFDHIDARLFRLRLDGCQLINVPIIRHASLSELFLSSNFITVVAAGTFSHLPSLRVLRMQQNPSLAMAASMVVVLSERTDTLLLPTNFTVLTSGISSTTPTPLPQSAQATTRPSRGRGIGGTGLQVTNNSNSNSNEERAQPKPTPSSDDDSSAAMQVAVGVGASAMVVLLVCGIAAVHGRKRRRQRRHTDANRMYSISIKSSVQRVKALAWSEFMARFGDAVFSETRNKKAEHLRRLEQFLDFEVPRKRIQIQEIQESQKIQGRFGDNYSGLLSGASRSGAVAVCSPSKRILDDRATLLIYFDFLQTSKVNLNVNNLN